MFSPVQLWTVYSPDVVHDVATGVVPLSYPLAHASVTAKAPLLRSKLLSENVRLASLGLVHTIATYNQGQH